MEWTRFRDLLDEMMGIGIVLDGLMYRSESESEHCPFSIGIEECVCVYVLCVRVCECCVVVEKDETRTNTSITSPTIQMYEHRYTLLKLASRIKPVWSVQSVTISKKPPWQSVPGDNSDINHCHPRSDCRSIRGHMFKLRPQSPDLPLSKRRKEVAIVELRRMYGSILRNCSKITLVTFVDLQ